MYIEKINSFKVQSSPCSPGMKKEGELISASSSHIQNCRPLLMSAGWQAMTPHNSQGIFRQPSLFPASRSRPAMFLQGKKVHLGKILPVSDINRYRYRGVWVMYMILLWKNSQSVGSGIQISWIFKNNWALSVRAFCLPAPFLFRELG